MTQIGDWLNWSEVCWNLTCHMFKWKYNYRLNKSSIALLQKDLMATSNLRDRLRHDVRFAKRMPRLATPDTMCCHPRRRCVLCHQELDEGARNQSWSESSLQFTAWLDTIIFKQFLHCNFVDFMLWSKRQTCVRGWRQNYSLCNIMCHRLGFLDSQRSILKYPVAGSNMMYFLPVGVCIWGPISKRIQPTLNNEICCRHPNMVLHVSFASLANITAAY